MSSDTADGASRQLRFFLVVEERLRSFGFRKARAKELCFSHADAVAACFGEFASSKPKSLSYDENVEPFVRRACRLIAIRHTNVDLKDGG